MQLQISQNQKHQKGFTLLEMVVSIGIVAVVSVVLSQVFIATLRSNTKTEIFKDIKQNGELALESMVRMIQNAKQITSDCTEEGKSAQSLTIINEDSGQTTLGCIFSDGSTRLASSSAESSRYLTSANVTLGGTSCGLSTLTFVCYGGPGIPASVTISFQLAKSGAAAQAFEQGSESFQTTATMRNSAQ